MCSLCMEVYLVYIWRNCFVESLSFVQLFCYPMDCSLPGSSVHRISQARILEWVAISFPRVSFRSMDGTHISCIDRWILYHWATGKVVTYMSSVQFSRSVVSDYVWPHEPQHARPPCPSPTPGVHPNPCPSSRWCHPAISFSVVSFSSCPQSFPASGSFQMSQLFTSGGQSIGVSASASVLPMNTQDWSPLGWTCWISLQSKGLSRFFSNTTIQKHQFFVTQLS